MTIAPLLVGAWRRQHLEIIGREPEENSRVMWLQTPSRYADIRVPLAGIVGSAPTPEAFAGRQVWQDPLLTFDHELDYTGNFPQDLGKLSWEGDVLVETGETEAHGRLQSIALRVDIHALVITSQPDFGACYYLCQNSSQEQPPGQYQDDWQAQWGVATEPPNLFVTPKSARSADQGWRLIESS